MLGLMGQFWRPGNVKLAELRIELRVESRNHGQVKGFAAGYIVQFLLQGSSVVVFDKLEFAGEGVDQQPGQIGGEENLFALGEVATRDDIFQNAG